MSASCGQNDCIPCDKLKIGIEKLQRGHIQALPIATGRPRRLERELTCQPLGGAGQPTPGTGQPAWTPSGTPAAAQHPAAAQATPLPCPGADDRIGGSAPRLPSLMRQLAALREQHDTNQSNPTITLKQMQCAWWVRAFVIPFGNNKVSRVHLRSMPPADLLSVLQ